MGHRRFNGRRAAALLGAVALAVTLTACDDKDAKKDDTSTDASSSASSTPTESSTGSATPSTVKLLDAGTGEKRKLRLEVEAGHTETATMSMVTRSAVPGAGELTIGMDIPMDIEVTDVQADELTMEASYQAPTVTQLSGTSGVDEEQMEQQLAVLADLKIEQTMTLQGQTTDFKLDASDALKNGPAGQFLQSIEQQANALSVPLPDEKVGVGGRWEATQAFDLNGAKVEQVVTYEVTELTDDTVSLKVSGDGSVSGTTSSAGVSVDMDTTLSTSGTSEMRSGLILPAQASTETSTTGTATAQGQDVDVDTTANVDISTK